METELTKIETENPDAGFKSYYVVWKLANPKILIGSATVV